DRVNRHLHGHTSVRHGVGRVEAEVADERGGRLVQQGAEGQADEFLGVAGADGGGQVLDQRGQFVQPQAGVVLGGRCRNGQRNGGRRQFAVGVGGGSGHPG